VFKAFFNKKKEDALRKTSEPQSRISSQDSCKRAVSIFPETVNRSEEVRDTVSLRFHHLLISLEGSERTGCLKIVSPRSKSRSAMLLYRGRVVGAVYGKKNMRGQYLHQDAHKCALVDLAAPGNMLDAYELPEDLVLSAASLFYGETLDTNYGANAEASFDYALSALVRSGSPGCVVVNSLQEETVCIVYVANGRIVGVFSANEGWTHGTPESIKRFLRSAPCKVHAAILPMVDQRRIGFSLTGLGDRLPVGAPIDATPYQDFAPAPAPASASAAVMTPSREAVAQAVRQHRSHGASMIPANRGRTYARVS